MSIPEDLFDQYHAYKEKNKNTPNCKPNPTMTYDDVIIVCDPDQKESIKFEIRRFHA